MKKQYIFTLLSILLFLPLSNLYSYSDTIKRNASQIDNQKPLLTPRVFFLTKRIQIYKRLDDELIGRGAKRSKQYKRAGKLDKITRDKTLIRLTNHKSPVVRCYAFQLLCKRKNDQILPILRRHKDDTKCLDTLSGCIGSTTAVFEFMYYQFEDLLDEGELKLSDEDQKIYQNLDPPLFLDCN